MKPKPMLDALIHDPLIENAAEMLFILKKYVANDDCNADGAPDANNRNHGETCLFCQAISLIARIEGAQS